MPPKKKPAPKAKAAKKRPREEVEDDSSTEEEPAPKRQKAEKPKAKPKPKPKPKAKAKRGGKKQPEPESDSEAPEDSGSESMDEGESATKEGQWKRHDTMCYYIPKETAKAVKAGGQVVTFDMDHTLIQPKQGRVHAQYRGDWEWWDDSVKPKLQKIYKEGAAVAIFSNQGGIGGKSGWDTGKQADIQGKIIDVGADAGVPIAGFFAGGDDMWRKPQTAMWDFFTKQVGKAPKKQDCIYVGDAAGRAAGWKAGRKKDFSCSDRKFAKNVGIEFQTPEEYFLGEKPAPFEWGGVETDKWKFHDRITEDGEEKFHSKGQEVVVFVGFPAAGKSTFAKKYLVKHGYGWVNRDTLKDADRCYKAAKEFLDKGKSVVIDNTNPHYQSTNKTNNNGRKAYIDLAKKHKIPVRCFRFTTDEELAKHLNYYRERLTDGKQKHVPRIGYATYKKNLEEPTLKEGFDEIKKINFVPVFADDRAEELFHQSA